MEQPKKSNFIRLLHSPRFWSHLVQACGGATGILAILHLINPHLIISIPIVMLVVSTINIWTENYKDTPTQVDDLVHLATDALLGTPEEAVADGGITTDD